MDRKKAHLTTPSTRAPETVPDIEDTLDQAFHMSSIAATLAERAFGNKKAQENLTGRPDAYFVPEQDVDTLLFALYEAHAQIRLSRHRYLEFLNATA
jgi:hypothetical protein